MDALVDPVAAARSEPARLVAAATAGDRDAFAELVEPLLRPAMAASIVLTRSRDDAADAVQDALLAAWLGLDRLRDPEVFPAWFRTHVVRSALRVARRRRRVVEIDLAGAHTPQSGGDELERTLERRLLGRAFDRLSLDDRALLTLRYLWGAPVAEVARFLGVPEGTVRSRTHAALRRLRAVHDAEARR